MKKYRKGRAGHFRLTEDMVDPGELKVGIRVEYEHTDDYDIAKQIALDHLSEIPDYYTRLIKMEKDAEKYWKMHQSPFVYFP